MIKYSATFIKSDTYLDKDNDETVPEGWYVQGLSEANDECPDALIFIEHAVDADGGNTVQATAERIAALLNADEDAAVAR